LLGRLLLCLGARLLGGFLFLLGLRLRRALGPRRFLFFFRHRRRGGGGHWRSCFPPARPRKAFPKSKSPLPPSTSASESGRGCSPRRSTASGTSFRRSESSGRRTTSTSPRSTTTAP